MKKSILFSVMVIMTLGAWVAWPAKYDLKVNLDKGNTYLFEYKNSQVVLVPDQAEADALHQDIRFLCEIRIDTTDENADRIMRCTFKEISLRSTQGRYIYADYNSNNYKNLKSNHPAALMAKLMQQLINESFIVKISNRGRVQEISGLNEIISRISSGTGSDPMLEQMLRASLKAKLSEELLATGFENTFCILPEGTVSLGETWTKENRGRLALGLNMKNIYTLVTPDEKDRNLLHFNIRSEISDQYKTEDGVVKKGKFACSQKGRGTLNSKNGLLNEAELEQSVSSLVNSESNSKTALNVKSKLFLRLTETEN